MTKIERVYKLGLFIDDLKRAYHDAEKQFAHYPTPTQAELVDYIGAMIEKNQREHDAILQEINTLEDETLRSALLLYSQEKISWDEIAEKMNYSVRTIYRFREKALEMLSAEK